MVRASSGSPSSGIERDPRLPYPAWDHLTQAHAGKESRSIKALSSNDLPDSLGNDDPCLNIPEGHDEAQFKLHNDGDRLPEGVGSAPVACQNTGGPVAQWLEQATHNRSVGSSILPRPTCSEGCFGDPRSLSATGLSKKCPTRAAGVVVRCRGRHPTLMRQPGRVQCRSARRPRV